MIKLIPIILLLAGCGKSSDVSQPALSPSLKQQLQAQVDRIMPKLEFCGGLFTKSNCDKGDTSLFSGMLFSVTKSQSISDAFPSIPENLACRSYESGFLGPEFMKVSGGKVWNYSCSALQKNAEFQAQKNLTAFNAKIAAESVKKGYRLTLLVTRAYLLILQGKMNADWADVVNRAYRRDRGNIFYNVIDNMTHSGSQSRFEEAASQLIGQMRAWDGKCRTQWSIERDSAEEAWKCDSGHSLVFTAKLLGASQ